MGLVCVRLKGPDFLTVSLLDKIAQRKRIFLVSGHFQDYHLLRFAIVSRFTEDKHIDFAWEEIQTQATCVFEELNAKDKATPAVDIANNATLIEDNEKSK